MMNAPGKRNLRNSLGAGWDLEYFLDCCTSCGACAEACTLLRTCGAPDIIISRKDENVFLCMNCGACSSACPSGCDPADALLQAKYRLLNTMQVSEQVSKTVLTARRFVQWGHAFPLSYYTPAETVFWPGCSLTAMSPKVVRKTQQLLEKKLGKKVGIALDCCSDPAYQTGDLDTVRDTSLRIMSMLERKEITSVIAACTNCIKVFSKYLPGVRVWHVLDILPDATVQPLAKETCYLHHPCPTYRFNAVQGRAKILLGQLGATVIEQTGPRCCGFGGNMHALAPELADACISEIMVAASDAPIVTYCMACKERFLEKGGRAYHILELLVSATPVNQSISSTHGWFNRLLVMLRMRLTVAGKR